MKVVIQSSIFLVASMLCSSAAILAAEDSHQRAYNSSIHGPNQVYRMEFRTSAVSFGQEDNSFNVQAYQDGMNYLYDREIASNDLIKMNEIASRKQSIDSNRFKKRDTNAVPVAGGINYATELFLNVQIGTSIGTDLPQLLPLEIDLGHPHILIPSSCISSSVTSIKKRSTRDLNITVDASDMIRYKRSSSICPSPPTVGFDASKSSSAKVYPGMYIDHDFDQTVTPSGTIRVSGISRKGIPALVVADKFVFGTSPAQLTIAVVFFLYSQVVNSQPVGGWVPPPVLNVQPPNFNPGLIGLAGFPVFGINVNPLPVGGNQIAFQGPVNINGITVPGPGASSSARKRSAAVCQAPQIMFGNYDSTKFLGVLSWFTVAPTPGTLFNSLWLLSLRNIQVGSLGTNLPVAQIVVNPQSSGQSTGTIQLDTTLSYILLIATRVATIYNSMSSSNFRSPSSTSPFWSYRCSYQPTITFEFVDKTGVGLLLTMDQRDWFTGLSIDSPGWCIGAIQELPSTTSQQLMGISFFQSFYVALQYSKDGSSSSIGLAINKRCGDV